MQFSTAIAIVAALSSTLVAGRPATELASRAAAEKADHVARAKLAITIPKDCAVCDGLGLTCVAACVAGAIFDPACDACAAGSLGIMSECISCLDN